MFHPLSHLLLASAVLAIGAVSTASAAGLLTIPASDARFRYEGRFDLSDPAAPVVVWQASRISIDFTGDSVRLIFDHVKEQAFFDVDIDGKLTLLALRADRPAVGEVRSSLGPGRHRLTLFKRSEANAGTARFRGIEIAEGAHAFAPPPIRYAYRMLFFGDSITVGACNEDGPEDQWEDRSTHNNAKSYGAMTAAAFSADYRNIAVSGMGIVTGYVDVKAGEMWNRVYPFASSPRADLTTWMPDVVFINLGENDDSYTRSQHRPFPSQAFADGYIALVRNFRRVYPHAEIVALRGGMFGGAESDRLRGPWEAAVKTLEKSDPHFTHFVFKHWSQTHPRVSDDRAMADELIAWLKQQPFLK